MSGTPMHKPTTVRLKRKPSSTSVRPAARVIAVPTADCKRQLPCRRARTVYHQIAARLKEPGRDGKWQANDAEGEAEDGYDEGLIVCKRIIGVEIVWAFRPGAGARNGQIVDQEESEYCNDNRLLLHGHGGAARTRGRKWPLRSARAKIPYACRGFAEGIRMCMCMICCVCARACVRACVSVCMCGVSVVYERYALRAAADMHCSRAVMHAL